MINRIIENKIIAVIRGKDANETYNMVEKIIEGGIKTIEITFTVPDASKLIKRLRDNFSDILLGAGTVINKNQFNSAVDAGAQFVVSPHTEDELFEISKERDILYIPGIMTPTEYIHAKKMGAEVVKSFPAAVLSPAFVKSLRGPFPEAKVIPTGGVNIDNILDWFKAGVIAVGVGSNLTKNKDKIVETSRSYIDKVHSVWNLPQ